MKTPLILLLNPNTAVDVTDRIRELAVEEAGDAAKVMVVTAAFGARYIASRSAAAIAGHAVLDAYAGVIATGAQPDGIAVACFGDPGIEALREIAPVPVVGFAESGFRAAAALNGKFAVATIGEAWRGMLTELVDRLGLADRLAGFIVFDEETRQPAKAAALLTEAAMALGASRVVIGGTGLIPVIPEIARLTKIPVIDPHRAAIRETILLARTASLQPISDQAAPGTFGGISPVLARLLERPSTVPGHTRNTPNPEDKMTQRGIAKVEGRHWVSEFNFMPEVTRDYEIPSPLGLIDSTIRKVMYTLGVRPNASALLQIGALLDELGVEEESLNVWYRGGEPAPHEFAAAKTLAAGGFGFKINVFTDTLLGDGTGAMPRMRETVDTYAAMGIKLLNPGLLQPPTADARQRQTEQLHEMAEYIRGAGMEWNATVANCGRRVFDDLVDLTNRAIEAGVRRLDLMDSTSALSPQAMTHFVRTYRHRMVKPTPLTMHTHNEFGMATAGTIAAVIAGASPDVALNGVSYRSGFAALEEVVLALDVLYGVDTGIRLDRLQSASERLAKLMEFPIPPLKPVVGSHQYRREAPGDIAKMLAGTADRDFANVGSSVAPSLTGARFSWVWAAQGGEPIVELVAGKLGLTLSQDETTAVCQTLDSIAEARPTYPRWATPEEVEAAIRQAVARRPATARGAA